MLVVMQCLSCSVEVVTIRNVDACDCMPEPITALPLSDTGAEHFYRLAVFNQIRDHSVEQT